MAKLLVSFATRPGRGSEGGVGWEFLKGAATLCRQKREKLFLVLDDRDTLAVASELNDSGLGDVVSLIPVAIPRPVLGMYGDRRTRQTYLSWLPRAKSAVRLAAKMHDIDVAQQITFATAMLPSVLEGIKDIKTVWGPINLPSRIVREGSRQRRTDQFSIYVARQFGKRNTRCVNALVATNEATAGVFGRHKGPVFLEPNIVAEPNYAFVHHREQDLLTFSGNLIDLKRPWVAAKAMQQPGLENYRLQFLGEGPLRNALESYVRQERLEKRISFLGRLSKSEAVTRVGQSRLLLHPSVREGASWVVGEAASVGVASVVFSGTGADSTLKLCGNGGVICSPDGEDLVESFAFGITTALNKPQPDPSIRWTAERIPALYDTWWSN